MLVATWCFFWSQTAFELVAVHAFVLEASRLFRNRNDLALGHAKRRLQELAEKLVASDILKLLSPCY